MIDTGILWNVGWGAVGVLVVGWIVVSFLPQGRGKAILARLSALAMYTAFLALFTAGFQRAESMVGTIGFGFLVAFFATGLLVTLWKGAREVAGGSGPPDLVLEGVDTLDQGVEASPNRSNDGFEHRAIVGRRRSAGRPWAAAAAYGGGGTTGHRDHYEKMIQLLVDQGAPLDGIGMQGHFGSSLTSPDDLMEILDRYAKFEKEIAVTEYDIVIEDEATSTDDRFAAPRFERHSNHAAENAVDDKTRCSRRLGAHGPKTRSPARTAACGHGLE